MLVSEAIQVGLNHHRASQLRQAEEIYRQVLREPRRATAMHLLGLIASQVGRHDLAVQYISDAIRCDGFQAVFHANLGEAYRELGKLSEARVCYQQALRVPFDLAEAHNNLGTILQAQGQLDDAIACYQKAIETKPLYANAHNNLGTTFQDRNEWEAAAACYRRAVGDRPCVRQGSLQPRHRARRPGRADEACTAVPGESDRAGRSDYVEARSNLATILRRSGDLIKQKRNIDGPWPFGPRMPSC